MPKLTNEKIHDTEPYQSILYLINFSKGLGLTQEDIFEGLRSLEAGEKESDSFIYTYGLVKRGWVNSPVKRNGKEKKRVGVHQQLAEQLQFLVDREFIRRDPKSKRRHYRYFPTAKYLQFIHVEDIYSQCLSYDPHAILMLKNTKEDITTRKDIDSDIFLFGFPPDSIDMSSKEGHQMFKLLLEIDDTLRNIRKKRPSGPMDFHWHID